MQEQAREGARAAEGQFGTGNKLIGMKKEECLKSPSKLGTSLESAQGNLPLAGSGCNVKR